MKTELFQITKDLAQDKITEQEARNILLGLFNVVWRSELLRGYFAWHEEKGYVSHKPSDIDEFLSEQ